MEQGIEVEVACAYTAAATPTPRVGAVAAMFGLGLDESRTVEVLPPTSVRLGRGRVVFVTGRSGGGKSTLLRLLRERLAERRDARPIDFQPAGAAEDRRPIVEAVGGSLAQATRRLAIAGLNDAFVMLRRPGELSDGQRYRFALARAMADAENAGPARLNVVLADEFGATLDRRTAKVIAANARRWTRREGVCLVAATTHDDLLEALEPDQLIVVGE